MAIPQFIRFYQGYNINSLMDEFAVTFFTLVNAMNRIKADESLTEIQNNLVPNMEKADGQTTIDNIKKASNGLDGYIDQANILRKAREGR